MTVTNLNGQEFMVLNLKSIDDSTRINFSDIATDLRFIPLETLPECLISNATYYITDNYILAKTKTRILQFDNNGKFIRILVTQGPGDFFTSEWVIDEKKDRLILADEQKSNYFLYFDLRTGDYLGDIPKAIPGITRRFALTAYGSLACVPYLSPGEQDDQYYLYWQDLKGKLLDTIKGPSDLEIYRDTYFEKLPEGYRYMLAYTNKDTVYHLAGKKLIPYLAFNHGEDVSGNMEVPGYRTMKIDLETYRYLILSNLRDTEVGASGSNATVSWTGHDYLVDKEHQDAHLISGIYNDFIGAYQRAHTFSILPNNLIYSAMQSLELIGIAERAIGDPKSGQKLIGRMKVIREQINREDNPVLIVGKVKSGQN